MTTDFRALCVELTDCLEKADWPLRHRYVFRQWIDIARTALADEPAVPEGREPTRDELWELWLRLNNELPDRPAAVAEFWEHAQINARARWGKPTPVPPADGEVGELVRTLTGIAHWRRRGRPGEGDPSPFDIRQADRLDRAAELLERLASPACVVLKPSPELIEAFKDALPGRIEPLLEECHPTPVPVAERLPGLEDCDAEGRCWFIRFPFDYSRESWSLEDRTYGCNTGFTHWLPAHALPIPQQQENAND